MTRDISDSTIANVWLSVAPHRSVNVRLHSRRRGDAFLYRVIIDNGIDVSESDDVEYEPASEMFQSAVGSLVKKKLVRT